MGARMKPARRPDWRNCLTAYLAQVARLPFRPGRHDCALFAAGAVEAMTGIDLAAEFRGGYRTLTEGFVALGAAGFVDHVTFTASHFDEVAPAFAQVGDVAVMPADGVDAAALGIVQGAGVYVLKPSGLAIASRLHMERAFQV